MTTLIPGNGVGLPRLPDGVQIDRRRFLKASLATVGAYAAVAAGTTYLVAPDKAWAFAYDAFEPEVARTLLAMTRALYPHDFLGDMYYAAVVKDLDVEASGFDDKERLETLRDGVKALNALVGGDFAGAAADVQETALTEVAQTHGPFFQAVRSKAVVSLYNQPEVWAQFGYEGPSFVHGGYLYRGFNDLSWLPDPPADASPPVQT